MPLAPSLLVTLVLIFGLAIGVVLILLGLIWARIRSLHGDETTRLVDDLARRQSALESLLATVQPAATAARGASSRRRLDPAPTARADGPTLIAVPSLAVGASESSAQAAAAELARRFGSIWERADAGAPADAIARETGQPVGQVELILALRRQLATANLGGRAEMTAPEPTPPACLERTRSAVLNRLVAIALGIALSGALLRGRDRGALWRASDPVAQGLLIGLGLVAVASVAVRRRGTSRAALRDPARRATTFRRAHVRAAEIGALAVPLGLAYGWWVRPRLDAVAPFWVAALALGALAWPRADELDGFEDPIPEPSEPTP